VLLVLGMFGVGYAARSADRRVERDLRVRSMPATLSAILASTRSLSCEDRCYRLSLTKGPPVPKHEVSP